METALLGLAAALRRHGLRVSTAEVVDAMRCASLPGMLASRDRLQAALRACLVTRPTDAEVFDTVFAVWASLQRLPDPAASGPGGELDDLAAPGAPGQPEQATLVDAMDGVAPIDNSVGKDVDMREFFDPDALGRGRNLDDDADLTDLASMTDEVSFSPSGGASRGNGPKVQLDVSSSRGVEDPGSLTPATGTALDVTVGEEDAARLLAWLGASRGAGEEGPVDEQTLQALLDRLPEQLVEHLRRLSELRRTVALDVPAPTVLDAVSATEQDLLEDSIRRLGRTLEGRLSQRRRPSPRGAVDPPRTMRRSLRHDGVPFVPVTVTRVRDKPRVVVLADVSLSVRATARFTLHVVHGMQSTFGSVRAFGFVDELVELTSVFERHPLEHALGLVFGGDLVDVDASSDYGTVFEQFVEQHGPSVDRRTSVIVLGDGRSNGKDPGIDAFAEIARRARHTVWLCPEPSRSWQLGASAMTEYAAHCDRVEVVRDLRSLERSSHTLAVPA